MNKNQAQQYYEELRRVDRAKGMDLGEIISILTSGDVSNQFANKFLSQVNSNEFGEYGHIYQFLQESDWRQLSFNQIYQILKCLKNYCLKKKIRKSEKSTDQKERSELIQSNDMKHTNHTVDQLLSHLVIKEQIVDTRQSEEKQYEQKWKIKKFRVMKKLMIIFDYFRRLMHVPDETFQKNQQISLKFDLKMFMRYIKAFDINFVFKAEKIIKSFKINALNTIWLDFDRFVNTNLSIIGFKQSMTGFQKYTRLKGLSDILSAEKIKKLLNIKNKKETTIIVEGHTGTYKQDVLQFLRQKKQKRMDKEHKKWSYRKLKTEGSQSRIMFNSQQKKTKSIKNSNSSQHLNSRVKTQQKSSIFEQLKLPKLRVKQQRAESIYETLKKIDLGDEKQKIKALINAEQNEQYLDCYLKSQNEHDHKRKMRPKRLYQLPPMRFT